MTVGSTEETMRCLQMGCSNRTTAATAMNSTSSRSHAIFTLNVEKKNKDDWYGIPGFFTHCKSLNFCNMPNCFVNSQMKDDANERHSEF